MTKKLSIGYLVLVLIQALHSIEEYFGQLWDVFPPAKWLTGLISDDRHLGFLVINIGFFVLGLLCWYLVVRTNRKFAFTIIWFWVVIELLNGIIHPVWSIMERGYTPGVITAPFLFIVAVYLIKTINSERINSSYI